MSPLFTDGDEVIIIITAENFTVTSRMFDESASQSQLFITASMFRCSGGNML